MVTKYMNFWRLRKTEVVCNFNHVSSDVEG